MDQAEREKLASEAASELVRIEADLELSGGKSEAEEVASEVKKEDLEEKEVEKPQEKVENRGKYVEYDLRERGIGKLLESTGYEWSVKRATYVDEGVYKPFMALKRSLLLMCTDYKKHRYQYLAHKVAQIMMDKFLMNRVRGESVPLPGALVFERDQEEDQPKSASKVKKGVLKATASKSDFTKWDGKIDTISDINWIYNNLMIADVKPEDAPSPGAWAHLMYHRSNQAAMTEFFTKVYPRLIPSKSAVEKLQDKFHDDGRATFDLLDRLLSECGGGPVEVPDIPVVLPEHSGLQDAEGQSAVSPEMP